MKILVVDEESIDLFIATKLLEKEHEVFGFSMPDQAIAWCSQNSFQIVLIDVALYDGVTCEHFLHTLQTYNKDPFKPFILTNYLSDRSKEFLIRAGFLDIITKPLTIEKFNECVFEV